jgi:hypothetical protein
MIVFCEDCGEKNQLDLDSLSGTDKGFRCAFCQYLNPGPVKTLVDPISKEAALFLKAINRFPEVIGSFFFHTDQGVMASNMPHSLKKKALHVLGTRLADSFNACQALCSDASEITLVISDKHMIVTQIHPSLFIIIASSTSPLLKPVAEELTRFIKNDVAL